MKQTPLIAQHRAAGAKLVDFAGWEMPIQYSGVLDEYHTVRSKAGLFDVSHMGRLMVSGSGALAFLQSVTTNDVAKLAVGQAHYSMVKTTTFNGVPLPSIWLWDSESDALECIRRFGYEDFRDRLS